jgi:truncated hemoglobin YjbI
VSETNKQCKKIESDPEVEKLIKKYHRKSASKDDLKKVFADKLKNLPESIKIQLGIEK